MQRINSTGTKTVLATLAAGLMLTGCSAYVKSVQNTLEYAVFGADSVTLTDTQINNLTYASQYVTIENQPRAAVVLGFVDGERHTYVSANNESVVLRHGRMLETEGLDSPFDAIERPLKSVHDQSADPLVCLTTAARDCEKTWQATVYVGEGMDEQSYHIRSEFRRGDTETLTLPGGRRIEATRWTEHLTATLAGQQWHYQNHYWISQQQPRVVKSTQQLTPDFPRAEWVELKPYVTNGGQ